MDPLGYFRGGFDRLFDDLTRDLISPDMGMGMGMGDMGGRSRMGRRGARGTMAQPSLLHMDMCEAEDHYCCFLDCPGCSKEDINVSCDDTSNTVTVTCKRAEPKEVTERKDLTWITRERPRGRGQRVIYFDQNCDMEKAEVKCQHGCVMMKVPKKAPGQGGARQLQIQ